jgi:hypothetical protein
MVRLSAATLRFAIFCHRWMGVAFSVLFMWWFVSGIVIMYWSYPEITEKDRLERAPAVDGARIKLTAEEAAKAAGIDEPTGMRLASFDGRPVYEVRAGQGSAVVYADTGEVQDIFSDELNLRTVAAWARQPASSAQVEVVEKPDQWTLLGGARGKLPLRKYTFPDGQQVYLKEDTGEILQWTTLSARILAHLGAIPHWLYYTPLRVNSKLWTRVVVWSSGIATVATTLGMIVGIWMLSPRSKYRHQGAPSMVPYSGPKRLHTILGLFFGILTMTWAFSGMMSMEPFEFEGPKPSPAAQRVQRALAGGRFALDRYAMHPRDVLAKLPFAAKELTYTTYLGDPVWQARSEDQSQLFAATPIDRSTERVQNVVANAAGEAEIASMEVLTAYDRYYLDRTKERPLPVIALQLKDSTRLYIDPKTARVTGRYAESTATWVNRWLYHGLHSLDFPWLYNNRPAWDILVLTLMLACVWLCWTSLQLTWRVLKRTLVPKRPASRQDLAL